MDYSQYFHTVTAHVLYQFQQKVADTLLRGKNVILRAPTGSGKTLAVTLPYFYAKAIGSPIADKLIYSVPLRSLGSTIANEIRHIFPKAIYHDGNYNTDPYFEKEVIVTTIDQTLSAYMGYPFNVESPSNRNITRGSLIGSLLIFDEFHLYDLDKLGHTTLDMIHRLDGVCQWVIMSATISDSAIHFLRTFSNTEVIELTDTERFIVNQNRTKHIICSSTPVNAKDIVAKTGKSIVLCNTVSRSQAMYDALIAEKLRTESDHRIILLHSRFLAGDRERKEAEIMSIFGKETPQKNAILVATQTIEAGLDISCKYLYTELAPANALIQRIGRCARFENEEGWITIYDVIDTKGNRMIKPYDGEKEIIEATWKVFQCNPVISNFETEIRILNDVYAVSDMAHYSEIFRQIPIRDLYEDLFTHRNDTAKKYIRDILTTNVSVININDEKEKPRQTLGVAPYIIASQLKLLTGIFQYGWIRNRIKTKDEDNTQKVTYTYMALTKENLSILTTEYPYYIILFTSVASYDDEYGLLIGSDRHNFTPEADFTSKIREPYKYLLEPYSFHANAVAKSIYEQTHHTVALHKLCQKHSISEAEMETYLDCLGKYHDIGKLNLPCQKHFHTQQKITNPLHPDYDASQYYAHSDFDSEIHKKAPNPVTHSYQSAYLSANAFKAMHMPKSLSILLCFAIAKHHSSHYAASTDHIKDITLDPEKAHTIYSAMGLDSVQLQPLYPKQKVQDYVKNLLTDHIRTVQADCFPLLIYFQRVLRLGDWDALKYMQLP